MYPIRENALFLAFFWISVSDKRIICRHLPKPIITGSDSVAQDYSDRRKHPRIEVARAIFIEVVQRDSRSESDNAIIRCETIDISAGGLRIHVPQAIRPGCQLNIAVPMEDWKESLELIGDALWVKPVERGSGFWVGLALRDSNPQAMKKWCEVVRGLSSFPAE
ncbi:MAG: PilZ domain-containing protein [Halioglobus sp.]|nr:PilZ domain-containing protein [Halioglobus sp.]